MALSVISSKLKIVFIISMVFLFIVLIFTFLTMGTSLKESKNETGALIIVKNLEHISDNIVELDSVKELYLKTGNKIFLRQYETISTQLTNEKKSLLDYSIEQNFKKGKVLLLANAVDTTIINTNKTIDLKINAGRNIIDSNKFDGKKNMIDSVLWLAKNLQKESISILKTSTLNREVFTYNLLLLLSIITLLFFGSLSMIFVYLSDAFRKLKKANKILLYNSTLLKNIYDAIIITDNNCIITDWNEYAEKLYGYSEKEAQGKSIKMLLNEDEPTFKNNFLNFLDSKTWNGEMLHYHKNSTNLHVDVRKTSIKNINKKDNGCAYIIRDISERVKLEQKLKNISENLQEQVDIKVSELNLIFERITDAFIAFDNDWNYTYLNKMAQKFHGVKENEIIGKNIWALYPNLVNGAFYEFLQKAKTTQLPQKNEVYYSKEDKWFANLIYPSANGISVYYHEVTSKKKAELKLLNAQKDLVNAEAKFRDLVEKSMVGIYIRKDNKLLYVNPALSKLVGYTEEELYNNFNATDLIAESGKQIVEKSFLDYAQNQITTHHYDVVGRHKSGKKIYIEIYGSRTTYNGEDAVIGTVIDYTEQKTAMAKLAVSEEALKFSNERFELVAKATNDGIWDWDIENDKINGNISFCKMMDLAKDMESNYEHFIKKVHPNERENLLKSFKNAAKEKVSLLTSEFQLIDKDGHYKFIYNRTYILYKNNFAYRMLGAMQDITDMKESEKKLFIEKELSDSIINSLPSIFYLINKEGQCLRWNKNLETVSGYSTEEIKKINPLTLIAATDKVAVIKVIKNIFLKGSDMVEANFKIKNGTLIPYYFTGMFIRYQNEDCILGVGIDISEKIKSQKKLVESEQQFRTLVQQASEGIIVTNEEGFFIDVNDSAAALTGYEKTELEKLNIDDIFFEDSSFKRPMHYNAMAKGTVVISEHIIIKKSGEMVNVEVSAKQLSDGRFQRILRDITERTQAEDALRTSEKKYRLLFNDNPLPMWITSKSNGKFIDVNNAALDSYGYTKNIFLQMKLSDLNASENNLKKYKAKGYDATKNVDAIHEHIKKDGSKIKVNLITHDIVYEGKEAILSLANDITAKFKAEENLQKSNEAFRELASHLETIREKERSHIAREIHDELGQQLTGLKMDISWINKKMKLEDEIVNQKMKDTISLIDKTVITVRRIATQLRPSILDDLGLIAAMEWQGEEFEKRSEIKSTFNSNVSHVTVSTDVATAVFRIFQESLTNVLRHSKATEVISFLRVDSDIITLLIEDNGIGFNEIEIENKKTLGLLGMRERIQLINGTYEINGNTGKGTSVIITVPLVLVS